MMHTTPSTAELGRFLTKWRLAASPLFADGGVAIQVDDRWVVYLRAASGCGPLRSGWWLEAKLARRARSADSQARQIAELAAFGLLLIAASPAAITMDPAGRTIWLRQRVVAPADSPEMEAAFEQFCDALTLWHARPQSAAFSHRAEQWGALWA